MTRQRPILLSIFLLAFIAMSGWLIYEAVHKWGTQFVAGAPPISISSVIVPKTVELGLLRPPALRATDFMRYGGTTSSASLILFGNYSCAACKELEAAIKTVAPQYHGAVRYIWRDLPQLDGGRQLDAAVFAYCAGLQNKFWETHDALLSGNELGEMQFLQIVQRLSLDLNQMDACRTNAQIVAQIRREAELAQGDGVTSTPILFVGSRAYAGTVPAEEIDKELKKFLGS